MLAKNFMLKELLRGILQDTKTQAQMLEASSNLRVDQFIKVSKDAHLIF